MVCGDAHRRLQRGGRLDEDRDQARRRVPLDMAVEEPHAWVVGAEANHEVAQRLHQQRVAARRHRRELRLCGVCRVVDAGVFVGSAEHLEVVSVKVERVFARVLIVELDLDYVALF